MTEHALSRWATWSETLSQPGIWRDWAKSCDFAGHRDWVAAQGVDEVWFCGAGTSAFIGDIIVAGLEGQRGGPRLRSVPTTDLVARPQAYLRDRRPLVVSFGRSGNSSESLGTLDALDALAPNAPRLNITCNGDSALARRGGAETRVIILPEATHDSGFAMTSSFSTMLLTALAIFGDGAGAGGLTRAADRFDAILPAVQAAVGPAPGRAVFLGTGPLAFAAREAALKVMELSAGGIPCLWDSILGFRHGPKSFVTDDTRLVAFIGADTPGAAYEADLVAELRAQFPRATVTTIGPGGDIDLPMTDGPVWAAPLAVLFAQVAGVVWADAMGMNVDDPFAGQGTLTRVVSGVTLYPVQP
ncbi:SIS domain-containing protein [Loktanella sp. IMCC34160]|uniref:SIS domain-containing protein n=1 Tax=Loktanella sp. IMCC34160 TaxID=2510646 RepID=UPI00101D9A56|nr:SIS domain-containing protein [Loktanella sp. IMCC34160]RYG93294.1 SIS domain-containing protein [Loktanella sp. IMCC34160]